MYGFQMFFIETSDPEFPEIFDKIKELLQMEEEISEEKRGSLFKLKYADDINGQRIKYEQINTKHFLDNLLILKINLVLMVNFKIIVEQELKRCIRLLEDLGIQIPNYIKINTFNYNFSKLECEK